MATHRGRALRVRRAAKRAFMVSRDWIGRRTVWCSWSCWCRGKCLPVGLRKTNLLVLWVEGELRACDGRCPPEEPFSAAASVGRVCGLHAQNRSDDQKSEKSRSRRFSVVVCVVHEHRREYQWGVVVYRTVLARQSRLCDATRGTNRGNVTRARCQSGVRFRIADRCHWSVCVAIYSIRANVGRTKENSFVRFVRSGSYVLDVISI